jgi:histidyl-tRNA synthetase
VGSTSLINEAELLCIYRAAFQELGIPKITVKINSRKLLAGLAEVAGVPEQMMEMTIALDKLDKIGWEGVTKELLQRGISEEGISRIKEVIAIEGNNDGKLAALKNKMQSSEIGLKGVEELQNTLAYHTQLADANWLSDVVVDVSLARGLNYYTGVIVEVTTDAVKMGSIGGGGRYDDLTGLFGLKGLSGVGVSFGIDRIYDVMEELQIFPEQLGAGAKVMLVNFGGGNELYALKVLQEIRRAGIAAELYPDAAKFDKQMKYANKRGFGFVMLCGDEERKQNLISLKNFTTGEQKMISLSAAITQLQ